jgi:hypothetical protein
MAAFYNLIIAIGGSIIAFLAFADEISNKIGYFKNIKSLAFKIPFFIIGSVMILLGSILKDIESENSQEERDKKYSELIRLRDSTHHSEIGKADSLTKIKIQQIIDSSYTKSIKASNEALAKYNLILVDSLHSVANKINIKSPLSQLDIDANSNNLPPLFLTTTENGIEFNYRYISAHATSYNIQLSVYLVKHGENIPITILQYFLTPPDSEYLIPGRKRTASFQLIPQVLQENENLLVIFLGKYSRDETAKEWIEFKSAFEYNFRNNKFISQRKGVNYLYIESVLNRQKIPHP